MRKVLLRWKVGRGKDAARSEVEGFTLIEILIVISIIALLSSFVLVAVSRGRESAHEAMAKMTVGSLNQGLENYLQDETILPGSELTRVDCYRNDFHLLYNALLAEARPKGPGGRNAPYAEIKEDQVNVRDEDTDSYRKATAAERRNVKIKKYILDPWGHPYVYRANKGKKAQDCMHKLNSADIYSIGKNGIDDTAEGKEESDDIGNWN